MIFEICAIIATLAFLILVFYLILTLRATKPTLEATKKSLESITNLLIKIDNQIVPLTYESMRLLQNSNDLTESIHDKIEMCDPLFESVSSIGQYIQEAKENITNRIKKTGDHLEFVEPIEKSNKPNWQNTIADVMELAALAILIFKQAKKEKHNAQE